MNRGYSNYHKKAKDLVSFTLKKRGTSANFMMSLYLLVSFFGKLVVFLRPIFVVSDNNVMTMIEENHNFSFLKAFEGTKKKYLSLLTTYLVIDVMCLVPFIVILLPTSLIALPLKSVTNIIVFVLALLICVITDLVIVNRFAPTGYLAVNSTDFDTGDYLYNSNVTMKDIKGTVFRAFIGEALTALLFFVLVIVVAEVFSTAPDGFFILVGFLLVVLVFFIYTLFGKMLITLKMTARFAIKDNALLKKAVVVKRLAGTKVKYEPLFKDEEAERSKLDLTEDK